MPLDEILLIASNIGTVIVTGWLIMATAKEAHKHEERRASMDDAEIRRLTEIVDDVVEQKHSNGDDAAK